MPLGEEGKDVRNERLSEKPSAAPPPKATMTSAAAAAQTVLARRSNEQIPLSLGKASLRIRLEAYYSLISPDTLSNRTVWLRKYDQIYEKYGGTYQGERKLATKLAKKYGTTVRLLVVTAATAKASHKIKNDPATTSGAMRDESWYRLRPEESGSGVLDVLKPGFDPLEALTRASKEDMARANPWMEGSSILDNLDKCATLLSEDDPMHRDSHYRLLLRKAAAAASKQPGTILKISLPADDDNNNNKDTKKRPRNNPHPFETIASYLDSGPHSFLFRMREERKRVKIVIRYVNMVRGTLTGTIIAFDKHMNMILRDVEEVYSPRLANEENKKSNLDLELERQRRIRASKEAGGKQSSLSENRGEQHLPGTWNVRRRQMKQLMVRGDMIVSVYEAGKENNTVASSRYYKRKEPTAKRLKGDEGNN